MPDLKVIASPPSIDEVDTSPLSAAQGARLLSSTVTARPVRSTWLQLQKKRDYITQAAIDTAHAASKIHYRQVRPVQAVSEHWSLERFLRGASTDCSGLILFLADLANRRFRRIGGVSSPGGYGHTGYGNSYSMESTCRHVSAPVKADIAFYNGHVAIVVQADRANPEKSIVVSHGSESGPHILRAGYRSDLHGFGRFVL